MTRVLVEVDPVMLFAFSVTLVVPAAAGVPDITAPEMLRPAGRPVAE